MENSVKTPAATPIFDGHNDVLSRLLNDADGDVLDRFLNGDSEGHLDLPRMREAGFGGGFFAIYVASPDVPGSSVSEMCGEVYDLPLPPEIDRHTALPVVLAQAALLLRIERASQGQLKICTQASDLHTSLDNNVLAAVLHMEGAEAIDENFETLEVLYSAGLRSLGPVWSRPTRFGHGVPFRFPASPDTGDGLTDAGKQLIRECNRLGIMVDLSHLNEKGFWDVAAISKAPLVATHSNAHAICLNSRNLTDEQLAAIRDSDGMVGVNFATSFIRSDGQMDADTTLDELLRHIDYLLEHLGEDRVGFGSDFDGATIPAEMGDVVGLLPLRAAMQAHGFGDALMTRLCYENWVALLERTWR